MKPITEQELLNANWAWFSADPRRRAAVPRPSGQDLCQYRVPDEHDPRGWRGCAIGNWMPDEVYQPKFEAEFEAIIEPGLVEEVTPEIGNLKAYDPKVAKWLKLCSIGFLEMLQKAHDYSLVHGLDTYRDEISRIARTFNLTDPTEA